MALTAPLKNWEHYLEQSERSEALKNHISEVEKYAPIFGRKIRECYELTMQAVTENNKNLLEDARENYDQAKKEGLVVVENIRLGLKNNPKLIEFQRFFANFLAHPKAYQTPDPIAPLTIETIHGAMTTAITLVTKALEQEEGICAQFSGDIPVDFIRADKPTDTYPELLEKYFKGDYARAVNQYLSGADAHEIDTFSRIGREANNIRTLTKKLAPTLPADKKLSLSFVELDALLERLCTKEISHKESLLAIERRGAKLQRINHILLAHFEQFERHRPKTNGFYFFRTNPLDDQCKEFYTKTNFLFRRIQGLTSMRGAVIKCIAPALIEELMRKLTVLKEDFFRIQGHEEYPGFLIANRALASCHDLVRLDLQEPGFQNF